MVDKLPVLLNSIFFRFWIPIQLSADGSKDFRNLANSCYLTELKHNYYFRMHLWCVDISDSNPAHRRIYCRSLFLQILWQRLQCNAPRTEISTIDRRTDGRSTWAACDICELTRMAAVGPRNDPDEPDATSTRLRNTETSAWAAMSSRLVSNWTRAPDAWLSGAWGSWVDSRVVRWTSLGN